MSNNRSTRPPLASRLKIGLIEAIRHAKGQLNLRTTDVPQSPPRISRKQVARLREKFGMSQSVFAGVLNVSTKTVQSWEQGQREPSQAALRMLQLLDQRPNVVCETIGLSLESHLTE